MNKLYTISLILLLGISQRSFSQTVPVGSYAESLLRTYELLGEGDTTSSFCVRPVVGQFAATGQPGIQHLYASENLIPRVNILGSDLVVKILQPSWQTVDNPTRPYGYNNGTLYPNVGFQTRLSAGVFIKLGILNIQVKPEYVNASNKYFSTFAETWGFDYNRQLANAYFFFVDGADAPERFGATRIIKMYPGQSKISLIYKGIEAGLSTENLWWGPATENSIMMSNSAPGFLHGTFNSAKPINIGIGTIEWQLIGGLLTQSGFPPMDPGTIYNYGVSSGLYIPKPQGVKRYMSGYTVNYHPKWFTGFYLGTSGYDYLNKDSLFHTYSLFKKLLPEFAYHGTGAATSNAALADQQDYAYSIYARQIIPKYNAEIYIELARNDGASNLQDFLLEPEHSSAHTIGAVKLFKLKGDKILQVKVETTNLQDPPTYLVRSEPSWYVKYGAPPQDGYTNEGRYLGAGIGPGGLSSVIDVSLIKGVNTIGLRFERFEHNNDLYYNAFSGTGGFDKNWVDLPGTLYIKAVVLKNILVDLELTRVYTLNYEYYTVPTESKNITSSYSFSLNLSYLLKNIR